jgi:HD-GYP domain-containing protein (c-di-GMP phosphodiesterase class II)
MQIFGPPIASHSFSMRRNSAAGSTNNATARPLAFGRDSFAPTAQNLAATSVQQAVAGQRIAAETRYNQQQRDTVTPAAVYLGQAMGLSPDRLGLLRVAAQYYNEGKRPELQALWTKAGAFSPNERQEMQNYPLASVNHMLAASLQKRAQGKIFEADELERAVPIVLAHKYNYTGAGYPGQTMSGNLIPLESQILGVVDAYYAMLSPRPYRPAMTPQAALQTLQAEAGTEAGSKWNPVVVAALVSKAQ